VLFLTLLLFNRRQRAVFEPSARPARLCALGVFAACLLAVRGVPADESRVVHSCTETVLSAPSTVDRSVRWAEALKPLEMTSLTSHESVRIRLYANDGSVDDDARTTFERIAAGDDEPHSLTPRLEQLVVKAAYHFKGASILVVSGWRENAGRHGTGDALDFKLRGVRASLLASYLRQLPRAGVGIYTHPRTQFVHLDVRDASYHWIDASPPGVRWVPGRLRDPAAAKRDASWLPEMDLPL